MDKVVPGIGKVVTKLARGKQADADTAKAILTTDLVPKVAKASFTLGNAKVSLGGICKGSGMIAPNMATMLGFITTDANITPPMLKAALVQAVNASFNRVTVDTDTSTSDAVIIMASGASGHPVISAPGKAYDAFVAALTGLCQKLAYQLVRDGEGATKVFRVKVTGGKNEKDADKAGRAVAESPLVKTAIHGGDPNWGRLSMAVGKSGASFDPDKLELTIGGIAVYQNGLPIDMTPAVTKRLEKIMAKEQIDICSDLKAGHASVEWLGCDLSREYITINADYTT
jgi:glutamate N-acetyltransferase/amino-acid N-acetyltransferase